MGSGTGPSFFFVSLRLCVYVCGVWEDQSDLDLFFF
jgi:hypothetical protein